MDSPHPTAESSELCASFVPREGQRLEVRRGDLSLESADALVNAANRDLEHGRGVALAMANRAGPLLQAVSTAWVRKHGPLAVGAVAVTAPGRLRCRHVLHAMGPIWTGGERGEVELLRRALRACLAEAHARGLGSLAMPALSCGGHGFPRALFAELFVETARTFFEEHPGGSLRLVRCTSLDDAVLAALEGALANAERRCSNRAERLMAKTAHKVEFELRRKPGWTLRLVGLNQWQTYAGLFEGPPFARMNDRIVEGLWSEAGKRGPPGLVPLRLQPARRSYLHQPGDMDSAPLFMGFPPEFLPSIACVGTFDSGDLMVVAAWFQEDFALPIDDAIAEALSANDLSVHGFLGDP